MQLRRDRPRLPARWNRVRAAFLGPKPALSDAALVFRGIKAADSQFDFLKNLFCLKFNQPAFLFHLRSWGLD